jgi:hypothetical protein
MVRRSTPQRIVDDRAFPIRIKFVLPWNGFGGRYDAYVAWLNRLGPDGYAWHSASVYFRDLTTASQFLGNFPELMLADTADTRDRPGRIKESTGLNILGSMP